MQLELFWSKEASLRVLYIHYQLQFLKLFMLELEKIFYVFQYLWVIFLPSTLFLFISLQHMLCLLSKLYTHLFTYRHVYRDTSASIQI